MVSDVLFCSMFERMVGRRALFVLGSFPYFLMGSVLDAGIGTVKVRIEEGTSRELQGLDLVLMVADIVMFHVERYPGEIPSLENPPVTGATAPAPSREPQVDIVSGRALSQSSCPGVACELAKRGGKEVTLVLKPAQVNLLGQVFRPIVGGRVRLLRPHLVLLDPAVLKIPTAPNHHFPTPLAIPLGQIAGILPLAGDALFPLP
ncbi:MAG: hypothetical protein Q8P31_06970 [Bacillota bacterium]|nr:hypothetical protein [Bacillota bacterium]